MNFKQSNAGSGNITNWELSISSYCISTTQVVCMFMKDVLKVEY